MVEHEKDAAQARVGGPGRLKSVSSVGTFVLKLGVQIPSSSRKNPSLSEGSKRPSPHDKKSNFVEVGLTLTGHGKWQDSNSK